MTTEELLYNLVTILNDREKRYTCGATGRDEKLRMAAYPCIDAAIATGTFTKQFVDDLYTQLWKESNVRILECARERDPRMATVFAEEFADKLKEYEDKEKKE